MMPICTIVLLGLLVGAQSKSVEHIRAEHHAGSRGESAANEKRIAEAIDSSRAGLDEVAAVIANSRDGQLLAHEAQALSEELSRRGLPASLMSPLLRPLRPRYYLGRNRPGFKSDDSSIVERLAASHVSAIDPLQSNRAQELVHLLVAQRGGDLDHVAALLKNRADSLDALQALHEAASRAGSPAAEHLEQVAEAISRASAIEAAKELIEPAAQSRNAQEHIAAVLERANSLKALHELQESSRGDVNLALEHAAHAADRADGLHGLLGGQHGLLGGHAVRHAQQGSAPCILC